MLYLRPIRKLRVPLTGLLASSLLSACCIPSLLGGNEATLYQAEVQDEETFSPRWYGLLSVDTETGTRYVTVGPYDGCTTGEEEGSLFVIECFWAGLMNTVRIGEHSGSVVVSTSIQDEGMEGSDEQILEVIPLEGASVKAAGKGVQTLSLDEIKAKAVAWGAVEASLPRPDRPNPMTGVKSKYTDVGGKCSMIGEPGADTYDVRCPGLAGYSPVITRMGYASWTLTNFSLDRRGAAGDASGLDFSDEILRHDPGENAGVTEKLIEWRYREVGGGQDAHGLIFRIYGDRSGKRKSKLFVARLEGSYGCIVGTTRSNKEARRVADNMNLRCSGPNTVATESGW